MALIAALTCLSPKANSPLNTTVQPFRQMQPQRLNQYYLGELLRDEKTGGLRLAQPMHHPQRAAKHHLSDSFSRCTTGGSAPKRIMA